MKHRKAVEVLVGELRGAVERFNAAREAETHARAVGAQAAEEMAALGTSLLALGLPADALALAVDSRSSIEELLELVEAVEPAEETAAGGKQQEEASS